MESTGFEPQIFELIFQGLQEGAEKKRDALVGALRHHSVSQIFEVEYLLDGGPFLLGRSANREALQTRSDELQKYGAKVTIVQCKNRRSGFEPDARSQSTELTFKGFFQNYTNGLTRVLAALDIDQIEELINDLLAARQRKSQILIFGNGGSASTASHMVNDFTKQRFDDESLLFRCLTLNDNMSWLSATANDFGYEQIFVQQLKSLLRPDDVVIGISSSGNSPNVTKALRYANEQGATTYGIVGFEGGEVKQVAKKLVYIPTKIGQYGFHEDVTLIINHMMSIYIYERDRALLENI